VTVSVTVAESRQSSFSSDFFGSIFGSGLDYFIINAAAIFALSSTVKLSYLGGSGFDS